MQYHDVANVKQYHVLQSSECFFTNVTHPHGSGHETVSAGVMELHRSIAWQFKSILKASVLWWVALSLSERKHQLFFEPFEVRGKSRSANECTPDMIPE